MRMTKEMYESLQVKDLKAIAEGRGIETGTRPRKDTLVKKLLKLDEEEDDRVRREAAAAAASASEPPAAAAGPAPAGNDTSSASGGAAAEDNAVPARKGAAAEDNAVPARKGAAAEDNAAPAHKGAVAENSAASAGSSAPAEDSAASAGSSASAEDVAESARRSSPAEGGTAPARQGSAPEDRTARQTERPARQENATSSGREERRPRRTQKRQVYTSSERETASFAAQQVSGKPAPQETPSVRNFISPFTVQNASASESPQASAAAGTAAQGTSGQQGSTSAGRGTGMADRYARRGLTRPDQQIVHKNELNPELDSGEIAHGILEVMGDGFGFIRSSNYMPGDSDVYVAPSQIRRFSLKTGDIVEGNIRVRSQNEKFSALLFVKSVNGMDPEETKKRYNFEDMTPIFPNERIRLERPGASIAMRVMDLMCPVGKGQRGMIVSPPKAGKTTLLKEVAKSVKAVNPNIHLIILLIDERPEEVTDLREALEGPNVEVIYSTFDELPEHHKRVAEMTIERAKRLVEHKEDVMILLDSITRLTRAYNLTEPSSGRTLSGGLDPVALHMPKRFFGAARNMREGGSLTILATALIETGSKMDDVVYEEFKGTGNMEMILNRKLSERRIFPAVDLAKSGTRRDDLLLTPDEQECVSTIRRAFIGARGEEATDSVLDLFSRTRTNGEFVNMVKKHMWSF